MEFNAFVNNVLKELEQFSDGQQIEAGNIIYKSIYATQQQKVKEAKKVYTQQEVLFEKFDFKVPDNVAIKPDA